MQIEPESLPFDLAAAHAMIRAEREARLAAEKAGAAARLALDIEIERLKLEIARLRRERFGASLERSARIEQLELKLEELEEAAAGIAAADPVTVETFDRRRPARRPLPDHLPRRRIVHPGSDVCPCCGGTAFSKLGEDVTETLERVPASWRVVQHVRERFSCRACETISQAPAPFHPISRGRAGPGLLADVVFSKFGLHLPLHRQSERFTREGVPIEVSTLADWSARSRPRSRGSRLSSRLMCEAASGSTSTTRRCRSWQRVGPAPAGSGPSCATTAPSAGWTRRPQPTSTSPTGRAATPRLGSGPMPASCRRTPSRASGGFYDATRRPGAIVEAACWAHGRSKFFEMADLKKAPMAVGAIFRIDAIFAVEREINGLSPADRQAARDARSRPLVEALHVWLRQNRTKLSAKAPVAKAIGYMLKRWPAFTRFLDDGRICLSNNAAKRAIRPIAVGRRNWTFAGSDAGGRRAAAMYTLIETAKVNGIDPRAWLADVLARLPDHPAQRVSELLPWNWPPPKPQALAA